MILLLFSATYPFGDTAEQGLLARDVEYLAREYDRVILVPKTCKGAPRPLPAGVEVEESYAALLRSPGGIIAVLRALFSAHFYQDIRTHPWLLRAPRSLVRLIRFIGAAMLTRQWVEGWLERTQTDSRQCMFYTYWFDQGAMGIGLAKKHYPHIRIVSKVHNYDLYEERYDPPYWPCRRTALSLVDGLFADSEAGARYLKERYPEFAFICGTALEGVPEPGFLTPASQDGVFRIVSCAIISPVKRIDLLLEGINCAARMRPLQNFEWYHFGEGETRIELQERAATTFPSNARGFLPGYYDNADLMRFYQQYPIDVFVNLSLAEGTPRSIMEAISCGIPVIATAVGGNAEIVSERNGLLLDPEPTPEEIALQLLKLFDHPEIAAEKRNGSRSVWQESYRAEDNYPAFINRLKAIRGLIE